MAGSTFWKTHIPGQNVPKVWFYRAASFTMSWNVVQRKARGHSPAPLCFWGAPDVCEEDLADGRGQGLSFTFVNMCKCTVKVCQKYINDYLIHMEPGIFSV